MPPWDQGSHDFAPVADYEPAGVEKPHRSITLSIPLAEVAGEPTASVVSRVLLIRMTETTWATVECDESSGPINLSFADHSGARLERAAEVEFREWRCAVPKGQVHPWSKFPQLVTEICDWIAANAATTGASLLGMQVPQEVAMGVGINVAGREIHQWPTHLWPLVKGKGVFVPGLDLGFASLHQTHSAVPR